MDTAQRKRVAELKRKKKTRKVGVKKTKKNRSAYSLCSLFWACSGCFELADVEQNLEILRVSNQCLFRFWLLTNPKHLNSVLHSVIRFFERL